MNSRKFVGWMLLALAVCGLGTGGFLAGTSVATCSFGCEDYPIYFYDPDYDVAVYHEWGGFGGTGYGVMVSSTYSKSSCGGVTTVSGPYTYVGPESVGCAYFDEYVEIDFFDDEELWTEVDDIFQNELEDGTFYYSGCTSCT